MASEALIAQGNSLALSRTALLAVGGATLGPIGALIGLAAGIGLEARRLHLEGYRIEQARQRDERAYELKRYHLDLLERERQDRKFIADKTAEISATRANTERVAVEGSLFIAQARLNSAHELQRMRHQVDLQRARINGVSKMLALDTLAIKSAAASQQIRLSQFKDVLVSAFQSGATTRNPQLHESMFEMTLVAFERIEIDLHGRTVITPDIIDDVLRVPDLVAVSRREITRA